MERWADDLRQGPSVKELVAAGYLVPSRVFSAEQGKGLAMTPVEAWLHLYWYGRILKIGETPPAITRPLGRKRRALVPSQNKAHARRIVAEFEAKGVPAAFIGDDTKEDERKRLLGWTDAHGTFHEGALARGEIWALACAVLLRQGYDEPKLELILSARTLDSEPLARQYWGRGMRVCPSIGKVDCVMVDLVGGIVDRVGLPDDERAWSLEGEACRAAGEALPACVQCRACLSWGRGGVCRAMVPRGGLWVECGFALPPPPPPRVLARDLVEVFAGDSAEQRARTLLRFVGEAWLAGRAKGKQGRDLIKAGWSGAYRWAAKYPVKDATGATVPVKPPPRDVARAMRDTGIARLVLLAWVRVVGLCSSEGDDDMSRGKSGALKAAVRPKSDAGHAGWRPKVDMAASMQINGLRPAPVEPVLAAIVAPIEAEAREIAAPVEPHEPRRMTQPGLFDALGVKV